MKLSKAYIAIFILLIVTGLSSCSVVKGVFDAGMVWGIVLVIGVIGLIIYLLSKVGKNK